MKKRKPNILDFLLDLYLIGLYFYFFLHLCFHGVLPSHFAIGASFLLTVFFGLGLLAKDMYDSK